MTNLVKKATGWPLDLRLTAIMNHAEPLIGGAQELPPCQSIAEDSSPPVLPQDC